MATDLTAQVAGQVISALERFFSLLTGTFEREPACGRVKGVALHPDGYLYAAESYRGLVRINVTTGEYKILLHGRQSLVMWAS